MKENLVGEKFGRLTVICKGSGKKYPNSRPKNSWLCRCECGNIVDIVASDLKNGHTQSCGCLRKEVLLERNTTHNKSYTRLHGIWDGMKSRCYNSNQESYIHYGARGIKICDEWRNSFEEFYDWAISHGYNDTLTIDRVDVNGDYCPTNCRWATKETQQLNKRTSRFISFNGETKTLKEWADIKGLAYSCLLYRLDAGWDVERALNSPSKKGVREN